MKESVSIVITTKNEEKNIKNCLESIKIQTYEEIDIIVVDNNSEDSTKEIAKKYTNKVFNKGPERSAQRNYGMIEKAKGKYVMFIDADMILSPSLIENCVKEIKKNFLALHIPEIVLGKSYFSKVRRFERSFYNGTVIDGARFFLKEAFVKVNGFDESLSGPEDWDIDKKLKRIGKIGLLMARENSNNWKMTSFIKERGINPVGYCGIYHNESEFNLRKYVEKKGYYAKSFDAYIKKWNDEDIKKQTGFYYRFIGVFVENSKWKRLFLHPILAFGMYFLRFLVGVKFITRKENAKKVGSK